METFRCYKIGFFLTSIGVFVLVRIVSLCRISKWPRLDWKMQKIVHFGNLSWNNGQIQWIWCLRRNKLFLTMWEVKFATKVCNIMNYSPNTPTLMFNWCINCFNCKLHLQFVSLLFFLKATYLLCIIDLIVQNSWWNVRIGVQYLCFSPSRFTQLENQLILICHVMMQFSMRIVY